jgi:hypothetical protein
MQHMACKTVAAAGWLLALMPFACVLLQAFMDAGIQCNFIRAYVRLHKTPPAKLRVENSDTEQV